MASENKKRKAKNGFLYDGAEKNDYKSKRVMFFNKRLRNRLKKDVLKRITELEEEPYEHIFHF